MCHLRIPRSHTNFCGLLMETGQVFIIPHKQGEFMLMETSSDTGPWTNTE